MRTGHFKVTECLIMLMYEEGQYMRGDAHLFQTATAKYLISVGAAPRFYSPHVPVVKRFPLIHLFPTGFAALICPTIAGGKWAPKLDLNLCNNRVDVVKGHRWNIITA